MPFTPFHMGSDLHATCFFSGLFGAVLIYFVFQSGKSLSGGRPADDAATRPLCR
jgi:hypothetical protein